MDCFLILKATVINLFIGSSRVTVSLRAFSRVKNSSRSCWERGSLPVVGLEVMEER